MQRCKEAKKAKRVAQSKHGKYINIARKRKVYIKHTNTTKMYLTNGNNKTSSRGDRCDHISTSPWRAQSRAKPRSREAKMEIKHRSKQTNIDMHKGNDPNPLI